MKKICAALMALTFVLLLPTVSSAETPRKPGAGVVGGRSNSTATRRHRRRKSGAMTKGEVSLGKRRRKSGAMTKGEVSLAKHRRRH
jgi:hypothetical protein